MNGHAGIYMVQNIHCFTTAKVSTQRRRVSTQQRRDLRCCVPKSGQRATHRRKVLCRCGLERYTVKMLCLLHSGVDFYAGTYQKVWTRVF